MVTEAEVSTAKMEWLCVLCICMLPHLVKVWSRASFS